MIYLLDTNACVVTLRHGALTHLATKLASAPTGSVVLCSIVVAELRFGAYRSQKPADVIQQVGAFCQGFISLPFDDKAADAYAQVRAHLARLGQAIGPNDLLIAAVALANGLVLVTHDTSEFSRVPGLMLEDWQTP